MPARLTGSVLALLACLLTGQAADVWTDPGFEELSPGPLADSGHAGAGWEIQKTGRDAIQPRLRVGVIGDAARAKSGARCLALSIPADTAGFEFVTVGRRVKLAAEKEYEAGAWVRWPEGPDAAPASAGATSGDRSAIVSFWARHRDGTGDFAGRDEWLFDNQWRRLTFRFRATDPEQPVLLYVSLLPNQKPAATTVLVDDFELREADGPVETESRKGTLTGDADFQSQKPGPVSPPWYFANIGGKGITGEVVSEGRLPGRPQEADADTAAGKPQLHFRLAMNRGTSNFESAQLWQHVALREGARYEISCRIRWDTFAPDAPAPIVNFGIYHDATRTWHGPVDQVLEKTGGWRTYRFIHIPPHAGPWKLYVQLNGWGNFGNGVGISVDDFRCVAKP